MNISQQAESDPSSGSGVRTLGMTPIAMVRDEVNLERWRDSFSPVMDLLVTEFRRVQEGRHRSATAESLLASSDQLRSVARRLAEWIPVHPCPVADVDLALTKIRRSTEWLADLLQSESVNPAGPNYQEIGRELDGLWIALSEAVSAAERG